MKNVIGPLADKAVTLYILSVGCIVLALIVLVLRFNLPDNSLGNFLIPISLGVVIVGFILATTGVGLGIVGDQRRENYARMVAAGGFVLILIYACFALFFLYYITMR